MQNPLIEIMEETVQEELKKISNNIILKSIIPLSGDASNRSYYRLFLSGFIRPSIILMKLNQMDRGIVSEEIVDLQKKFTEVPFLNIQRFLYKIGVKVPEVYLYSEKDGLIFLEDFGDDVMWQLVKERGSASKELYRKAIEQLVFMQYQGIKNKDNGCYAFWHIFDEKLYMWEFVHFIEFAIEKRGKEIKEQHRKEIINFFKIMSGMFVRGAKVFTHRDYHSKNLMVLKEGLGILDFQDALLGPPQYDLASLLRDSYVELDDDFIYDGVNYYIDIVQKNYHISFSDDFIQIFDLVSIQRNLKAAGRFHYIDIIKKNPNYLPFVPGTLKKVKRNLQKYPWLKPLHELLAEYVEELR
jgi:aminoglycoside/choline kinase family phosphotransferase